MPHPLKLHVEVHKPTPINPTIKGLIKLHKPDLPIRPVVNWRNAPAYKMSRSFIQKIKELAPLPYAFNVKNTARLIQDLKKTPIQPSHTFASLDISNMYSNIPLAETRHVLNNSLENNIVEPNIRH
jgi:hypothetical protein